MAPKKDFVTQGIKKIAREPTAFDDNGTDTANATASTATVTLAADTTGHAWVLTCVYVSYSVTPTTPGILTVKDGSTTVFQQAVGGAGPFVLPFDPPKIGTANTAMTITLTTGGTGVIGYVSVNAYEEGP